MSELFDGLPLNTPTVVFTQAGDFQLLATRTAAGGNVQVVAIGGGPTDLANQAAANLATVQSRLVTGIATIETFILNNPSGAVLTAGQTLAVAKMLAGLGRIVLGLTSTVGQT